VREMRPHTQLSILVESMIVAKPRRFAQSPVTGGEAEPASFGGAVLR
jgi:hypothetical protein